MRSRLTLCSVQRRVNPLAQCTIRILGNSPGLARPFMFTVTPRVPQSMLGALRYIGGGAVSVNDDRVGKSFDFQLMGSTVFFEVSVMKSHAGKTPIRKSIYLSSDAKAAAGSVTLRVGTGEVDVVRGPLRVLTSAEARKVFGTNFKETMLYSDRDSAALGLKLSGETVRDAVRQVETINESGIETVIAVRRRRRAIIV